LKSAAIALAVLASSLATSAFADQQIYALNNQVYLGGGASIVRDHLAGTALPEDDVYQAVVLHLKGDANSALNTYAGIRYQPHFTGLSLEARAQRSSSTLKNVSTVTGLKDDPIAPQTSNIDWSSKEAFGRVGWAFAFDGGGMQATPFVSFGTLRQSRAFHGDVYELQEQRVKSTFLGVGVRHQTSLTPTLALELEAAVERHNVTWDQISLDVFGQPDADNARLDVNRATGYRLGANFSQNVWRNVWVNYGINHSSFSAAGSFDDMPVTYRQKVTTFNVGLGIWF
jgi:hypothetical protein